jgi:glycosyltransferase involved in cell wall biosynthesis
MRILLTAPLKRHVTPEETSSRSFITYQIATGLALRGHDISLLGTADSSIPHVKTIPVIEKGWVDTPPVENQFLMETASLIKLNRMLLDVHKGFDIIHNHTYPDFFVPQTENELVKPLVTTIHAQGTDYIDDTLSQFSKTHFISISHAHRKLFPKTPINTVVHNGVDTNIFSFSEKKGDYLLWLGRLARAKNTDGSFMDPKGVKWAIRLAQETQSPLLLSGNVEDMEFFNRDVQPFLNEKIKWVGPVSPEHSLSQEDVAKLMQQARAYLMPINWQEPFGLVMAEAGSCGTPVIAFDRGSVPEIIVNGKTGFVVPYEQGVPGLVEAYKQINTIKPKDCREHIEKNFSVDRMVASYEKLFQEIIASKQ